MAKKTTPPQPKISRIIMLGIAIVGVGTFFYHIVEKLSFIDSLYFSVITLTTIGYGDIVPKTDVGKIFTVFYVLVGISLLAGIANYVLKHSLTQRIQKRRQDKINKN
jgi:voltage-gated potassium channel Kch